MSTEIALTDILDVGNIDPTLEIIGITKGYKTVADTPEKLEAAFRWISGRHQYLVINGVLVDVLSANTTVRVLDALSPENKAKLLGLKEVTKITSVAWKLIRR